MQCDIKGQTHLTDLVNTPIVSNELAYAIKPHLGMVPYVGFIPTTPQNDEGCGMKANAQAEGEIARLCSPVEMLSPAECCHQCLSQ